MKALTDPYLIALGIPLILIFCGAMARKLVRGSQWQRTDFFLAVELALAAMAAALVYIFDLATLTASDAGTASLASQRMMATASFLALCFFSLLWVLAVHQDWERRTQNPKGQFVWLAIIANLVGVGLLTTFVLFVKGV